MLLVSVFYPRGIASNGLRSILSCLGGALNLELRLLKGNLLHQMHKALCTDPSGPFGSGNCELDLTRRPLFSYTRYLAATEGSSASSTDPWVEFEAELTVLWRRARRHGHSLQQLDDPGGIRLVNTDEDLGQSKAEYKHDLDTLRAKMLEKTNILQARIHKMENEVRKLSDGQHRHRGVQLTTPKKKEGTAAANYS